MRKIELLAPAKTADIGIEAVIHGADAVYIGAPQFSARANAGNSVPEIARLVSFAHRFRAKVYVALNTILTDEQLLQAESIIWQLYEVGMDALIIQDMGLLRLSLPPVALHASTQMDNRTPEKVRFLESVGFSQIVLARELSLHQIKTICAETSVAIECFVHGALCVSYSGQCYASQATRGRSANRGECAQLCRLPYRIEDASGNALTDVHHFLSLKDLDLSAYLLDLMEAGVTSFKIEGRLKEMSYVKNVTAYYRRLLDQLMEGSTRFDRASLGRVIHFFEPDPQRTFHRGATDYFLNDRHPALIQPETPKSMGQLLGKVICVTSHSLLIHAGQPVHNGDGLSFVSKDGTFTGFRVNRVEGQWIYPFKMPVIQPGTMLFRTFDQQFEEILSKKSAERRIPLSLYFYETEDGFGMDASCADVSLNLRFPHPKEHATKEFSEVRQYISNQFSRLGETIFVLEKMDVTFSEPWFIPSSVLSGWRRNVVEQMESALLSGNTPTSISSDEKALFPSEHLSYAGNVSNQQAAAFYLQHGVTTIDPALEIGGRLSPDDPVMTTKYCLKFELGWCPRQNPSIKLNEPLFLQGDHDRFQLHFDCAVCEMRLTLVNKNK
ncbi:MAG: peptidase U32 family protein [Microbacter sp.]